MADRRLTLPDGALYDDDTNKAVFYCGRVAVAYTGLARMEGKPTAEWIGLCMKDAKETESAMKQIADRAERHLRQISVPDKRLAIVSTGWATLRGKQPLRPFICVASNFMMKSWDWGLSAKEQMVVRTIFLDERSSHLLFVAGQTLSRGEIAPLGRFVRRAVAHGATARAVVRLLGETVQSIARGADDRAEKVGKGMIIHLLSRKALLRAEETGMILTP